MFIYVPVSITKKRISGTVTLRYNTLDNVKIAIARKRLKIVMRLTSIESSVTFTAIVPGAYPWEAKTCKNVLKWRTFELKVELLGNG